LTKLFQFSVQQRITQKHVEEVLDKVIFSSFSN